ncbi:Sigma-54 dependent transcriptional regulator/response regulator (fragment) [Desulfamplus magnetovallimortis]|uniref:Sigma-54 dependent transcriptional regulator/response regulator n=1 Tax=Desulfamplus magnetovallimortis TaxID=1246637 RepID=A0A1W1HI09_9BACT
MKILFVDDDVMTQEVVKEMLKDWELIIASSAEDALENFPDEYDLIVITDIHMPGMSGIDLLREIKKNYPYVQVIMVSSTEDAGNLLLAYESGANDFIVKPFIADDLLAALDNTVQKNKRWKKALGKLYNRNK